MKFEMDTNMLLPSGNGAALLEKAVFNVPGIFLFSQLIYQMIDIVYDKTGFRVPIKYIYGAPQLRWNNGRLILNNYNNDYSIQKIEKEIFDAKEKQIVPLLTFSNLFINSNDLKDEKCNQVLKILNDVKGGVIVASDVLKKYIMEKYPQISLHASVILTTLENDRNIDYYDSLSKKYQYYVVHPDDNFNSELLAGIPKKNAEIIVNERCFFNCKIRKNHYEAISKEQIAQADNNYSNSKFLDSCKAIPEKKQSFTNKRNVSLTKREMIDIYNMGYRLFKLQGRTDDLYVFFFDLLRYTLDNEIVFPTIYPIFSYYIEKFKKGAK